MTAPDPLHRQVAQLHAQGISQGFLPTLGEPFLALLYAAIDASSDSVLITRVEDGRLAGFVTGSLGLGPVYKSLLRRPFRLARALLPVLVSPARIRRVTELLAHSRRQAAGGAGPFPAAELLSIVVAPEWRGRQVADQLYQQLVEHFRASGQPGFKIVVGQALAPAHSFYRRMGARPAGHVTVHGAEPSVVYVHDLSAPPAKTAG